MSDSTDNSNDGTGTGGGTDGSTDAGAAGGVTDIGGFDGSVSAVDGSGGQATSGLDAIGGGPGGPGATDATAGGGGGGGTVDALAGLGLGQMSFTQADAATMAGLGMVGVAAFATTGPVNGTLATAGAALMDAGPVATAIANAVHDASVGVGVLGTSVQNNPSISMFQTSTVDLNAAAQALAGNDTLVPVAPGLLLDETTGGSFSVAGGQVQYTPPVVAYFDGGGSEGGGM